MSDIEIPLSLTKIIVPALRPEILHRSRLLALFDDLLEKKFIIITAPAGYGKTSLLVDFARQTEMPVCWLSLDALDEDPQRFFAYVIAAMAHRFPKFGQQSNAVLRSLVNFDQDSERLTATLVNEINEQIDEHFVLILDDYHFVDGVPQIRDLFSRFIYLAGENFHVILSSRRLPTLPDIALMVARQQVGGFDLGELAFRTEEIRTLFKENYGIQLGDYILEELERQTEGWITGLLLSAPGIFKGVPDLSTVVLKANPARVGSMTGVDLSAYLDQQVLAPQPPGLRRFLLQSSLLEEFDADLCNAVLGTGNWEKWIRRIKQNNLFVLPIGPGGKWLRYHHLFQDFLQERFRQEEPESVQTILLRLAQVSEERHDWENAYAIYKKIGEDDLLAGLIERAGIPMLLNERFVTFRAWLNDLPGNLLRTRPLLLSHEGALLCTMGEGRAALSFLDQAVAEFQTSNDPTWLSLTLVRRAATYRLLGDYAHSLQDSDEAMKLMESKEDPLGIYPEAERFKGISLNHLGRITEAIQFLESALQHYEHLGEEQSVVRVHMELGLAHRAHGDYLAARNAYEQALTVWRRGNNTSSQAFVLNSLGVLFHYQGEYEQAVRSFETGLECARRSNSPWFETLLLTSLGDLYTDLDEYDSAAQAYSEALRVLQHISYQFLTNYLNLAQARLARLRGQYGEARRYLGQSEASIRAADSNYEYGLFYLELGCQELTEGNPPAAVVDLDQALGYFQRGHLVLETAWSQVWLAAAHSKSGSMETARSYLNLALGSRQSDSLSSSLLQVIRRASPWLTTLQEDAITGSILTPWLESATQAGARLPVLRKRLRRLLTTIPIQTAHLTIQAFGRAQVRVNGKLVTSAQWKTTSVRELFFYFLTLTRPSTKEEIGEVLWPEMDSGQLKLRFKNELYRLRRALGQDVILFGNELYHFNRFLDYEYDIENFETHLAKAKTVVSAGEKITNLGAAVGIRRGPYLQELDAAWAWPERERLERVCLDALKQLAESQHQTGDLPAALQACRAALKIDPCREDVHRLAMQLHAETGDRLAVIWQYQSCRDALHADLDIDPSGETEALYQRLVS